MPKHPDDPGDKGSDEEREEIARLLGLNRAAEILRPVEDKPVEEEK